MRLNTDVRSFASVLKYIAGIVILCVFLALRATAASGAGSQQEGLSVRVIPETVQPGEVAAVAITVSNPSPNVRRNVTASTIIPEGIESFLAAGTGGSCSNLLNNCIGGARLSWTIGDLGSGEHRTMVFPAKIRGNAVAGSSDADILFSVNVNWDGGGGLVDHASLIVASRSRSAPSDVSVSSRAWTPKNAGGISLQLKVPPGRQTARPGQVVPVSLIASNTGEAPVREVVLRLPVPHQVGSFIASTAGGRCSNMRNKCNPGVILHWSMGTLEPGQRKSFQVPLQIGDGNSTGIPVCATTYGTNGSGAFACLSVRIAKGDQ